MQPLSVAVVLGTRPEAIKLAPVILAFATPRHHLRPVVITTGQHREMLAQVPEWFGIQPDINLDLMEPNQEPAEFAARALTGLTKAFHLTQASLVVVQGDTTTAAMAALAAFYQKIPVAHVEAGLRTHDRYSPFPEEIHRQLVGVLATYHFPPTEHAAQTLRNEGIPADAVFPVGNTVVDALRITLEKTAWKDNCHQRPHRQVLITAHRRESFGSAFEAMCLAVRDLVDRNPDIEVTYPVHLNPNVRDPVGRFLQGHERIHLLEPLPYPDFVCRMAACDLILTDSGGIQEEAAVLDKPVLIMRTATERPEVLQSANAALVGTDREEIVRQSERFLNQPRQAGPIFRIDTPFGDGHAAERIAAILVQRLSALP